MVCFFVPRLKPRLRSLSRLKPRLLASIHQPTPIVYLPIGLLKVSYKSLFCLLGTSPNATFFRRARSPAPTCHLSLSTYSLGNLFLHFHLLLSPDSRLLDFWTLDLCGLLFCSEVEASPAFFVEAETPATTTGFAESLSSQLYSPALHRQVYHEKEMRSNLRSPPRYQAIV